MWMGNSDAEPRHKRGGTKDKDGSRKRMINMKTRKKYKTDRQGKWRRGRKRRKRDMEEKGRRRSE